MRAFSAAISRARAGMFCEREIYMRANGELKFVRISARFQKAAFSALLTVLTAWTIGSGTLLVETYSFEAERARIAATYERVRLATMSAAQRERYAVRRAETLEARHQMLESLARDYFGGTAPPAAAATAVRTDADASTTGSAADRMDAMAKRQSAFVGDLQQRAATRADRARAAVRDLGLDVDRLTRSAAQGGPFHAFADADLPIDDDVARLAETLAELDSLERALLSVPSFTPADGGQLSSRYGLRRDPFNRRAAMHKGQDFRGAHGSAIRAAAPGVVRRAGWWSGYGRAVVIDHGAGLTTRYGHMTRLDVRPGQTVARGDRIGGMGSTGRSTGTHLHFEVRIDGKAVNPRPFLEAPDHVHEIQRLTGQRLSERASRAG